jgi:hypothetical protein
MYYRRLKFCIIYLALNRGYFEAVLMKNTPRTLGVKIPSKYLAIPSLPTFCIHYNTINIL